MAEEKNLNIKAQIQLEKQLEKFDNVYNRCEKVSQ